MKKITVLAAFFLIFATGLQAQETRFGAKGGLNYSSLAGDLTDGVKFRLSGHLGIFVEIDLADRFAFQPELVYSSQGFQFSTDLFFIENQDPTVDGNDFRTAVRLNYLTIPLVAKFYLNDGFAVEFGPQVGFLLNQVTKIKNFDQDSGSFDTKNRVSGKFRLDYGAAIGLGIALNDRLSMAPRIYLGLRNRLEGGPIDAQNYNVVLQFSANYVFL